MNKRAPLSDVLSCVVSRLAGMAITVVCRSIGDDVIIDRQRRRIAIDPDRFELSRLLFAAVRLADPERSEADCVARLHRACPAMMPGRAVAAAGIRFDDRIPTDELPVNSLAGQQSMRLELSPDSEDEDHLGHLRRALAAGAIPDEPYPGLGDRRLMTVDNLVLPDHGSPAGMAQALEIRDMMADSIARVSRCMKRRAESWVPQPATLPVATGSQILPHRLHQAALGQHTGQRLSVFRDNRTAMPVPRPERTLRVFGCAMTPIWRYGDMYIRSVLACHMMSVLGALHAGYDTLAFGCFDHWLVSTGQSGYIHQPIILAEPGDSEERILGRYAAAIDLLEHIPDETTVRCHPWVQIRTAGRLARRYRTRRHDQLGIITYAINKPASKEPVAHDPDGHLLAQEIDRLGHDWRKSSVSVYMDTASWRRFDRVDDEHRESLLY